MNKVFALITCFILGFSVYCQSDCNKYSDEYKPIHLNDALNYMDCTWSDESKNSFKNKPEREAVTNLHFSTGASIRNYWGLFDSESKLTVYFDSIGINNPEDMSSIILTSFHRTLNGRDIDLGGQIRRIQEFHEPFNDMMDKWKMELMSKISDISVGDTIIMEFEVIFEMDSIMLVYISNYPLLVPVHYSCHVTGTVLGVNSDSNFTFIRTKVIDICDNISPSYYKEAKIENGNTQIGDILVYNASLYKFFKKEGSN